jgi:sulfite oxidase
MILISLFCEGYAWAGGGRRIVRVDLTADGGQTWTSADDLVQDSVHSPRHWSWTLWKVVFHIKKLKNNNLMRGAFF